MPKAPCTKEAKQAVTAPHDRQHVLRMRVLQGQIKKLIRVINLQYGPNQVKLQGDLMGRSGTVDLVWLRMKLQTVHQAIETEMKRGGGVVVGVLAPSMTSDHLYDSIRRNLRTLMEREVALESCYGSGTTLPALETVGPASRSEILEDLSRREWVSGAEGSSSLSSAAEPAPAEFDEEYIWRELDALQEFMVENEIGERGADGGHFLDGTSVDPPVMEPESLAEARAAFDGMTGFDLSEYECLRSMLCKHSFVQLLRAGMVTRGESVLDTLKALALLRRAAFEQFFASDQLLRTILSAGKEDPTWNKLYRSAERLVLPQGS